MTPDTDELDHLQHLQQFLAARDTPCPRCEYNLRGLLGSVCPECGEPLELRVGLVSPKQGALITGLIGIAAGLGLNGLLLIYILIQIIGDRSSGSFMVPFIIYNGAAFIVEGLMLATWLVLWRPIHRCNLFVRCLLATICWIVTLINIGLFSAVVR